MAVTTTRILKTGTISNSADPYYIEEVRHRISKMELLRRAWVRLAARRARTLFTRVFCSDAIAHTKIVIVKATNAPEYATYDSVQDIVYIATDAVKPTLTCLTWLAAALWMRTIHHRQRTEPGTELHDTMALWWEAAQNTERNRTLKTWQFAAKANNDTYWLSKVSVINSRDNSFFRSVAQYIGIRSKNRVVRKELQIEALHRTLHPYWWHKEDFKEMAEKLDKLFGILGILRNSTST